jgi:hypothetical protein
MQMTLSVWKKIVVFGPQLFNLTAHQKRAVRINRRWNRLFGVTPKDLNTNAFILCDMQSHTQKMSDKPVLVNDFHTLSVFASSYSDDVYLYVRLKKAAHPPASENCAPSVRESGVNDFADPCTVWYKFVQRTLTLFLFVLVVAGRGEVWKTSPRKVVDFRIS